MRGAEPGGEVSILPYEPDAEESDLETARTAGFDIEETTETTETLKTNRKAQAVVALFILLVLWRCR